MNKIYVEVKIETLEKIQELANLYELSERMAEANFGTADIDDRAERLATEIGQTIANSKKVDAWKWDLEYWKEQAEQESK